MTVLRAGGRASVIIKKRLAYNRVKLWLFILYLLQDTTMETTQGPAVQLEYRKFPKLD